MSSGESPKLLLVNYHYIRDLKAYRYPGIHPMAPDAFREEITWLKERFHMATPAEVEGFFLDGKPLPATSVLITLDDGLVDHCRAACEVLDPLDVKAAFFVCSRPALKGRALTVHKIHWLRAHNDPSDFTEEFFSHLDSDMRPKGDEPWLEAAERMYIYDTPQTRRLKFALNFVLPTDVVDTVTSQMLAARGINERAFCDETYMSDDQLRALSDRGHLVGIHGHSHTPFARLGTSLFSEVGTSQDHIARATGVMPTWVSYPNGRQDAIPEESVLKELFQRYGLRLGLTTYGTWNDGSENHARLHRINTNELAAVAGKALEPGLADVAE